MEDDIIPPSVPPDPPAPAPATGRGEVLCGFCESRITSARGEVIRLSARAKALRDFEDELEDVRRDLAERDATIADLRRTIDERDATIASLQPKPKAGIFS